MWGRWPARLAAERAFVRSAAAMVIAIILSLFGPPGPGGQQYSRTAVRHGREDLWRQHHFTTAPINQNPWARPARPALPLIYANILTIFSRPQLKSNLSH